MEDSKYDNVNMKKVSFFNINMSDAKFAGINLGGAHFSCIGPAPDKNEKSERQRPILFENMMLCDSKFYKVDMSGVEMTDCNIDDMKVDGVLLSDLINAYKNIK